MAVHLHHIITVSDIIGIVIPNVILLTISIMLPQLHASLSDSITSSYSSHK